MAPLVEWDKRGLGGGIDRKLNLDVLQSSSFVFIDIFLHVCE